MKRMMILCGLMCSVAAWASPSTIKENEDEERYRREFKCDTRRVILKNTEASQKYASQLISGSPDLLQTPRYLPNEMPCETLLKVVDGMVEEAQGVLRAKGVAPIVVQMRGDAVHPEARLFVARQMIDFDQSFRMSRYFPDFRAPKASPAPETSDLGVSLEKPRQGLGV